MTHKPTDQSPLADNRHTGPSLDESHTNRTYPRVDAFALHALALGAGAMVALSLPPWGWWPMSVIGIALFTLSIERLEHNEAPRRRRFGQAWLFAAGWMYLGMGWMVQLTVPGYFLTAAIFAGFHGVAALGTPLGRWALVGRAAAHALVEAVRLSFPFGGVPLATLGMSQVSGPIAGVARVGGVILLTWITFQIGMSVPALIRFARSIVLSITRRDAAEGATVEAPYMFVPLIGVILVVVLASTVAPRGAATGEEIKIAAVQGGGEQGTSALDVPSDFVTERHLEATRSIPTDLGADLGLILWPENTIDIKPDESFVDSWQYREVAEQAARLNVPLSVGITNPSTVEGSRRYTNTQVVIAPDGEEISRYDKVRRVPFGEYVPLRPLLKRVTSAVDRVGNAVAGTGPAILNLRTGERFAAVISWEVFFGGRAQEGVKRGGQAILNPTNGASFTGTIVQTQQVASSQLRAIETGRYVVQAAPTGFTAFVDGSGKVRQRSDQRERIVLIDTVELRSGTTWYMSLGDNIFYLSLMIVLALAHAGRLRSFRPQRRAWPGHR